LKEILTLGIHLGVQDIADYSPNSTILIFKKSQIQFNLCEEASEEAQMSNGVIYLVDDKKLCLEAQISFA
jgi:hypothetical protein